jgi:hypothetical protein
MIVAPGARRQTKALESAEWGLRPGIVPIGLTYGPSWPINPPMPLTACHTLGIDFGVSNVPKLDFHDAKAFLADLQPLVAAAQKRRLR